MTLLNEWFSCQVSTVLWGWKWNVSVSQWFNSLFQICFWGSRLFDWTKKLLYFFNCIRWLVSSKAHEAKADQEHIGRGGLQTFKVFENVGLFGFALIGLNIFKNFQGEGGWNSKMFQIGNIFYPHVPKFNKKCHFPFFKGKEIPSYTPRFFEHVNHKVHHPEISFSMPGKSISIKSIWVNNYLGGWQFR